MQFFYFGRWRRTPHKATILCGPPKFAWGIQSPTSLYDIIEDIYKEHANYEEHHETDFFKDIWPVLSGTYKLSWVNEKAFQGHGTSLNLKPTI